MSCRALFLTAVILVVHVCNSPSTMPALFLGGFPTVFSAIQLLDYVVSFYLKILSLTTEKSCPLKSLLEHTAEVLWFRTPVPCILQKRTFCATDSDGT